METHGNWRLRIQKLFSGNKNLTAGELVSETYQIISDAGWKHQPLDFLNQVVDHASKQLLKEAAAKKLASLGESEGFQTGYVNLDGSVNGTMMEFVPRSFVESLATWG